VINVIGVIVIGVIVIGVIGVIVIGVIVIGVIVIGVIVIGVIVIVIGVMVIGVIVIGMIVIGVIVIVIGVIQPSCRRLESVARDMPTSKCARVRCGLCKSVRCKRPLNSRPCALWYVHAYGGRRCLLARS